MYYLPIIHREPRRSRQDLFSLRIVDRQCAPHVPKPRVSIDISFNFFAAQQPDHHDVPKICKQFASSSISRMFCLFPPTSHQAGARTTNPQDFNVFFDSNTYILSDITVQLVILQSWPTSRTRSQLWMWILRDLILEYSQHVKLSPDQSSEVLSLYQRKV